VECGCVSDKIGYSTEASACEPGINRRSRNSRNFQLVDKISARGMVVPTRVCSSWTRNPPEEGSSDQNVQLMDKESTRGIVGNGSSDQNLQLMDKESTRGMVVPIRIGSSWIRNSPEEW
jgi:hypothetical protein